jgi:hypothetical protein
VDGGSGSLRREFTTETGRHGENREIQNTNVLFACSVPALKRSGKYLKIFSVAPWWTLFMIYADTSSANLPRSMLPPLTTQQILPLPALPLSPAATAHAAAPSQMM